MASTAFTLYVKPSAFFPESVNRASTFTAYIPIRAISGLFTTGVMTKKRPKNWKPHALQPIGQTKSGEDVLIDPAWLRHLSYLGQAKLGGATFPTLPEMTSFILLAQQNAAAITQVQNALEQMVTANAQSQAAVVQVVQTAALAGSMQIPPVVIARQETTAPPVATLPDSPGGDGGGGDGG